MIIAVLLISTLDIQAHSSHFGQVRPGRPLTVTEREAMALEEELMPKIEDHLRQGRPQQALLLLDRIPPIAGHDKSTLYYRAYSQLGQWESAYRVTAERLSTIEQFNLHFFDLLPCIAAKLAKGDREAAARMWKKYAHELVDSNREYYAPQYKSRAIPEADIPFAILFAASKRLDDSTSSIFLDLALKEKPLDAAANLAKGFKLVDTNPAAAAKHFLVARDNGEGNDARIAGRSYERAMKLAKKASGG